MWRRRGYELFKVLLNYDVSMVGMTIKKLTKDEVEEEEASRRHRCMCHLTSVRSRHGPFRRPRHHPILGWCRGSPPRLVALYRNNDHYHNLRGSLLTNHPHPLQQRRQGRRQKGPR